MKSLRGSSGAAGQARVAEQPVALRCWESPSARATEFLVRPSQLQSRFPARALSQAPAATLRRTARVLDRAAWVLMAVALLIVVL